MRLRGLTPRVLADAFGACPTLWFAIALFLTVLALFWPATGFEFSNLDDQYFITQNPWMQDGLTGEGVRQAFTPHYQFWGPLLWLSFMTDAEIFGKGAVGFHLMNVLLHALNAALVLVLLKRLFGKAWISIIAAALFAIHPLRVEAVAWIMERRGLLASFFLLLSLLAYVNFTRSRRYRWYAALVAAYLASLMAKPTTVTLPILLLILDFFPLRRTLFDLPGLHGAERTTWGRLILEKAPLFALAGAFSVMYRIIASAGTPSWGGAFSTPHITGRGAISYFQYLRDLLWPARLGLRFFDPLSPTVPSLWMGAAFAALVLITAAAVVLGLRGWPALAAGWLWYLVSLLPVTAADTLSQQWVSDRYTYVPHIFLIAGIVWTVDGKLRTSWLRKAAVVSLFPVLFALCLSTRHYLGFWKDGVTIAARALSLDPGNVYTRYVYAAAFVGRDKAESIEIYRGIVRDFPEAAMVRRHFAPLLWASGSREAAVRELRRALALQPDLIEARTLLADYLFTLRRDEEAADLYVELIRANRDTPAAAPFHNRLGLILRRQGNEMAAAEQFRQASVLVKENRDYHFNQAVSLGALGDRDGAVREYTEALRIDPEDDRARLNLAERLFGWGEAERASVQYREIARRLPGTAEEHLARGRLAQLAGNLPLALSEYRLGLRARPAYPEVRARLARIMEDAWK